MVWACFSGAEKGPMVDMVGDPEAKRGGYWTGLSSCFAELFARVDWIFMQDNAPLHTYGPVKQLFASIGYEVMEWPPYSPDLNPIEHVWVHLKENLHKYYPEFINMSGNSSTIKPNLADAIIHCWELLDPSIL